MRVVDIMSKRIDVCHGDDPLTAPAKVMWERDVGFVPVVDELGRAVAAITDRDISMAAYIQGKSLGQIRVRSAMSKGVYCCKPDDSVEQAERIMQMHQVRRLPVVDASQRVVGVLSLNDLSNRGAATQELARTIQAISVPRIPAAAE